MENVLFVHLLNNHTGSPMVLANYLKNKSKNQKCHITILTSATIGALSNIEGAVYKNNCYKWRNNKLFLSINLLFSHIYQFLFVLFSRKYKTIYINTILPFGASVAAKLRKMKIIYHVHEFYENPNFMHKVCVKVMCKNADSVIFVSQYLKEKYEELIHCRSEVVYNSTSEQFESASNRLIKSSVYFQRKLNNRIILMVCSLKEYKGVNEFIQLAKEMNSFNFKLVLSNDIESFVKYAQGFDLPQNLKIYTQIDNMIPFYEEAFLCLNLSHPYGEKVWIETFGMTLVEANCFGVPVFGPDAGGPKEIIKDGYNGFLIDPYNIENLTNKINYLAEDFNKYLDFCNHSLEQVTFFSMNKFVQSIDKVLE